MNDRLLQRVCAEYLEMPGLRLTSQQAQRLWGLDSGTCVALLEFLVDAKFLCRLRNGMYTRLTDGHHAGPPFEVTKAGIVELAPQTSVDLDVAARSSVNVMVTARRSEDRTTLARLIHARSAREENPFVAVCAHPVPAAARAAGARRVDDWFARAAGGTLFIDHVEHLVAEAQAQLLSRLTEDARQGSRPTNHRVRVISGSDRSLHAQIAKGAFSDQLFYRLNVIHIDQMHQSGRGAEVTTARDITSKARSSHAPILSA